MTMNGSEKEKVNRKDVRGTFKRGVKYFRDHRFRQCIEEMENVLESGISQFVGDAYYYMGVCHDRLEEFPKAVECLRAGCEWELANSDNFDFRGHLALGGAMARSGDLEGAWEVFSGMMDYFSEIDDPDDPEIGTVQVFGKLGNSLAELGRHPEARTCFEKALAHDPRDVDSLFGLGELSLKTGDLEGAAKSAMTLSELDPDLAARLAEKLT